MPVSLEFSTLSPNVVTLTDASTVTIDARQGNDFRLTLGGDRTMAAPEGGADGQDITVVLAQDATGGRTVTWDAAFNFGDAGTPGLSAAADAVDVIGFKYHAGLAAWLCLGAALGF